MKLLLLLSFVLAIHAHSWMRTPPGKYVDNNTPSDSQVAPCGAGDVYPPASTVYQGRFFDVSWENNGHDDSQADVNIRLLFTNESIYTLLAATDYPSGSDTAGDPDPFQVRIPTDVPIGLYTLQWAWSGYYTCARVDVQPDPNPTILLETGVAESNAATAEFVYYEAVLEEAGHHIFVEIEGPSGGAEGYLQVVMSKDTIPTLQEFEEMADTSGDENIAFGGCNDQDSNTFYIGVIGMSGSTGPYSITATSYDAYVNQEQEQDSPAHTGYRYYKTDSFETFDTQRRTIIESDGEINQDEDYLMALDCAMSESVMRATLISDSIACWQLPEEQDTKYFQVPPQTESYTIRTEEGSCEDVDGAISIVASFSLVLLLLVL